MQSSKLLKATFLGIISLVCLSSGFSPENGDRGLANCLDPMTEILPQQDIISQIQDQTMRESAMSYYRFLSQIEASAVADSEYARLGYGLNSAYASPSVGSAMISVKNFSLTENTYGATGHLWGAIPGAGQASFGFAGAAPQAAPSSVLFNGSVPAVSFGANGQNNPRINFN
jgi:hypothetical protein